MIDLARATKHRIGPELDTLLPDAAEDSIEIGLGNRERIDSKSTGVCNVRDVAQES
jgi:hypothetical protein